MWDGLGSVALTLSFSVLALLASLQKSEFLLGSTAYVSQMSTLPKPHWGTASIVYWRNGRFKQSVRNSTSHI